MKKLTLTIITGFAAGTLIGCMIGIIVMQIQLKNLKEDLKKDFDYPVLEVIADRIVSLYFQTGSYVLISNSKEHFYKLNNSDVEALLLTFKLNTTDVELAYKDGDIPHEGFRTQYLERGMCKRWAYVAVRNRKGIDSNVPFELRVREGNL